MERGRIPRQRPVIAPKINLGVKKVHPRILNMSYYQFLYCCIIAEVFVTTVSCDMSEISTSNERRLLHVRRRKVGPSINRQKLTNEVKKDF